MKAKYQFEMVEKTTTLKKATYRCGGTSISGYYFITDNGSCFITQDDNPVGDWINEKMGKYILGSHYITGKGTYTRTSSGDQTDRITVGADAGKFVSGLDLQNMIAPNGRSAQRYWGLGSYHSTNRSGWNVFKGAADADTGGIELETEWCGDQDVNTINRFFSSNFLRMEHDGSLTYGIEFITVPLPREFFGHISFWEPLCKILAGCGGKSHDGGHCGLHEHVNYGSLDDAGLTQLYELEYTLEQAGAITDVMNRIYRRTSGSYYRDIPNNCLQMITQAKAINSLVPNTISKNAMKKIRAKTKESLSSDHSYKLNVRTSTGKTFEFRQGRGSLVPKSIAKIAELNELKVKAAAKNIITVKDFAAFAAKKSKLSDQLFDEVNQI